MAVEYLDIVDEADNVIGRDTRDAIHKRHDIHRDVHVFVIHPENGNILVQKRSDNLSYYPGYHDAAVGEHVWSGETYDGAARRGTEEELGFTPTDLRQICKYKSYSERQRTNRGLFACSSSGPFEIDTDEVAYIAFRSPETIQMAISSGGKFTEGFKLSFEHYMRTIKA